MQMTLCVKTKREGKVIEERYKEITRRRVLDLYSLVWVPSLPSMLVGESMEMGTISYVLDIAN